MRERALSEVARITGGILQGEDAVVRGVVTDSAEAGDGDLFVALAGERVDGHDYVGRAIAGGATASLVQRAEGIPGPAVVVPDTAQALMDLAAEARRSLAATVVGITGSVGKTSVKDLAATVLAARYRVVASPRSFNTEVGVPLTLLAADDRTEVVVCEMGSRGRGHIARLCAVAGPHIGVVTGVGAAHLEMFGGLDAVAEAKAELPEALPAEGTAVLNADDPVVRGFADRTAATVRTYGFAPGSDVRGEDVAMDERGFASFTLRADGAAERVELSVAGEHMASNALAAAACGLALGLSAAECSAALKEASVSPWRMEIFETPQGVRVVNDAYNANPMSMAAALKAVAAMRGRGRCMAVLGEMAELGEAADAEHERAGELAARLGIDRLVIVGPEAARIAAGAVREGVEPQDVAATRSIEEALSLVRAWAGPGDVVLLKASRRVGLERLAQLLGGTE